LAIVAAALLAALGAVVLGEYPLEGTTAIVGFPLYGVAVTELALAIAKRLAPLTLAAVGAFVGAGLVWALWISFGHFRNDALPPLLSWVMVGVAVVASLAWGRAGRRRGADRGRAEPAGSGGKAEPAGSGGKAEPAGSGGKAERTTPGEVAS